ncbi:MAG: chemotaxis protein CheW [Terriglobales bacterium]
MNAVHKFVLFPLGARRFALPSERVAELARPGHLHTFPHTTPLLAGVLVRRGHIVPVFDMAQAVMPRHAPGRKFYLIATRAVAGTTEWTAIPVTGECELATAEVRPPTGVLPDYVTGLLSMPGSEIVEVIDLEKLFSSSAAKAAEVRA